MQISQIIAYLEKIKFDEGDIDIKLALSEYGFRELEPKDFIIGSDCLIKQEIISYPNNKKRKYETNWILGRHL